MGRWPEGKAHGANDADRWRQIHMSRRRRAARGGGVMKRTEANGSLSKSAGPRPPSSLKL